MSYFFDIDSYVRDCFEGFASRKVSTTTTRSKVTSTEDSTELCLDVPGHSAEDIEVTVRKDILTITGKAKGREFTQSYRSTTGLDTVAAKVDKGVLTVTLGETKKPESVRSIKVE